jgi:hypothetical protein
MDSASIFGEKGGRSQKTYVLNSLVELVLDVDKILVRREQNPASETV